MAGTEVVQGNPETHVAEDFDGMPGQLRVGHHGGFGDLQDDIPGQQMVPAQDRPGLFGEQRVSQVLGGNIDADGDVVAVPCPQAAGITAGPVQHPAGNLVDNAHFLGQRNPLVRGDSSEFAVFPAQQGFHRADPAVADTHFRLVFQPHVAGVQGIFNVQHQDLLAVLPLGNRRVINTQGIVAVQGGKARRRQQAAGVGAMLRGVGKAQ